MIVEGDTLMTVREVAKFLMVSPSLVYRLVEEGQLPSQRIGSVGKRGVIRIRKVDVLAYLERVTVGRRA